MSGCCMDGGCGVHAMNFAELFDKIGAKEVIVGENSIAATNGKFGGWIKTKDGSLVSIEYANTLNRARRRAEGIKL